MDKVVDKSKEIQGLYGQANSEGCFYSLLAKVELARFVDRKRQRLKEGKIAREEPG